MTNTPDSGDTAASAAPHESWTGPAAGLGGVTRPSGGRWLGRAGWPPRRSARRLIRQACHILAELGDDALTVT